MMSINKNEPKVIKGIGIDKEVVNHRREGIPLGCPMKCCIRI